MTSDITSLSGTPHSGSEQKYFASIDGLRTIAVLAVVIFHFFPKILSGGYAGVDVFFVISGFLVTGVIQRKITSNSFSYIDFYKKRIKRLFPALSITLICTTTFAAFFLLSEELRSYGQQLFSGIFFHSNILFFSEAGYFDKSSELKPLLHLWSLSLEEQFYFIWPFFLIIAFNPKLISNSRTRFLFLFSTCAISFLLCFIFTPMNQSLTFFNLPFRLWELGLGGLLAIYSPKIEKVCERKHTLIANIGLLFILTSFFALDQKSAFPGYLAALPVLGTLLVIAPGETNSATKQFLSHPVMLYIGKISYPLYLWHWPLFSFSYLIYGDYPPPIVRIALIAFSIFLAIFTYELIEKPVQKTKNTLPLLMANIVIGIVGIVFLANSGFPTRYPSLESQLNSAAAYSKSKKEYRKSGPCEKNFNVELCSIQNEGTPPTIAVIGDSHANHWFPGLSTITSNTNENILLVAKSGTAPLLGVKSKRNPDTDLDGELRLIADSPSIHTVILSAFWSNYFEEAGTLVSNYLYKNRIYISQNENLTQKQVFLIGIENTLRLLKDANKKVVFFHDIPALRFDFQTCLPRPHFNQKECALPEAENRKQQDGYKNAISNLLGSYGVYMFDPSKYLCRQETCAIAVDKNFLYSDSHHLSIWGSEYIVGNEHSLKNYLIRRNNN